MWDPLGNINRGKVGCPPQQQTQSECVCSTRVFLDLYRQSLLIESALALAPALALALSLKQCLGFTASGLFDFMPYCLRV